ncbi:MAG: 60 kDa inner rane insertion protein [Patescibacteria group bacterium]|nr:60 kDa inner rane insertion protein [Patescibacteria group bacterium]
MFHTIFYVPLYNALIFLTTTLGGNIGLGVIALTIVVKLILSPLAHASIKSQIEQKKLQPLVDDLKKKYPDSKEQSAKMMELYKEHKTNPLAGCLLLLLQLPVIIALYHVFLGSATPSGTELYSFVHLPNVIHATFLGINMSAKSIILAILAGLSQFAQMYFSPAMQNMPTPKDGDKTSMMAASMTKSMKYTMPVMIAVFGYAVPAAVTLYWIVSNIFMIIQERIVIARTKKKPGEVTVIKSS